MRVAVSGAFLSRPNTGSGQYLRLLMRTFADHYPDLRVMVLGSGHRWSLHSLVPSFGQRGENVRKVLWEQAAVPLLSATSQCDLLHVPYWAPPLLSAVPVVVTVHDVIPALLPEYAGNRAVRAYTALVSAATKRARRVIVDSQCSKDDAMRLCRLPADRVDVVPLAADPRFVPIDALEARQRCNKRWGLSSPFVLYAGGNDVRKDVPVLLRAWASAARVLDGHQLVLAGRFTYRPPFFPDIPQFIEDLDIPRVIVLGSVTESEKHELLAGCEAFVWPSRYEGFGLPPLEAMQCGAPVISTNSSSMPEVVGDAALLFEPGDSTVLSNHLREVCTSPSTRDRLRQASLKQAAKLSWHKTAGLTVASYQRALADR